MNIIFLYILNVIPYLLIILPIYGIFRICYIKKKLNGMYKTWHEIMLVILAIVFISITSQTIIPEFEYYNGSIKLAESIEYFKFNFVPFKILYQTYIEVVKYNNLSYFYISFLANILIFVPIGILLPISYKKFRNLKNTILFGITYSLIIEITQIFLPRATDIDDIILNTLGVLIGYSIFKILKNKCVNFLEKVSEITIFDVVKFNNEILNEKEKKYALVTGASSGIGYEMAKELGNLGFNIIAVARDKEKLENLKKKNKTKTEIIPLDLGKVENVYNLYEKTKEKDIQIVINNAGVGTFGEFYKTNLEEELDMIDLNIKCLHILSKLYLKDMVNKNNGYILNVSSSAAFMPAGPLMSSYYATKSYVLTLTNAIHEEIKRQNKNITISTLCLGPTNTNFNKRANIHNSVKELDAKFVANVALKGLFNKKRIITPGITNKVLKIFIRVIPDCILIKLNYNLQKKKVA